MFFLLYGQFEQYLTLHDTVEYKPTLNVFHVLCVRVKRNSDLVIG